MDNGSNQTPSENKKSRRDSSSKNLSHSQPSSDKADQSISQPSKIKHSGSSSKTKSETRSSKDSKNTKSSANLSEEKVNKLVKSPSSQNRSSTKKSQGISTNELHPLDPSATDLNDSYTNLVENTNTNNSEKTPRSSHSKGSSKSLTKGIKTITVAEEKKQKSSSHRTSVTNVDDAPQTIKKSSQKSVEKTKVKVKTAKPGYTSQSKSGAESADNEQDLNHKPSPDSSKHTTQSDTKTKSSPNQAKNENTKALVSPYTILKSKSEKSALDLFDHEISKNNDHKAGTENDPLSQSIVPVGYNQINGTKYTDKVAAPKIEISSRKSLTRTGSEKLKDSLPKIEDVNSVSDQFGKITISSESSNNKTQEVKPLFEHKYNTTLSYKIDTSSNFDQLRSQLKSLNKDLTSSISNPSKSGRNLPPEFPVPGSTPSSGAKVHLTSRSNSFHPKLEPVGNGETMSTLKPPINGTTTIPKKFSELTLIKEKMTSNHEDKDKRSSKVGKMVIRSQTDWLPRKIEYHERIWNNANSINNPNRYLECDSKAAKETMREFIHKLIANKKVSASSICPEGKNDFYEYINEIKMQKVTYGQWEYQRNIERAKRGMPNGLGFEQPLHILRGEQSSHILRSMYTVQPHFNIQQI